MTPDQIKNGRGALGLYQTEFAKLIGVRRSTVCSWEVGLNPPTPRAKNITKIKELFGRNSFNREWVGLTELEKAEITSLKWWDWEDTFDIEGFIRAIEAKLKEKNT